MGRIYVKKKQPGSKFFGNPDVWNKFKWPKNKKRVQLDFMCQIDCAQAAKLDEDGLLPKIGMLYFFFDLGNQHEGDCAVLYYDGKFSGLKPFALADEEDNQLGFPEYPIDFVMTDEDLADSEDVFLLVKPSDPEQMGRGAALPDYEQLLLEIDSYVAGHDFNFGGDCGMLCFLIKKADLAKKDFSKVWTEMAVY
jgi:uncharacterized protein YwqG